MKKNKISILLIGTLLFVLAICGCDASSSSAEQSSSSLVSSSSVTSSSSRHLGSSSAEINSSSSSSIEEPIQSSAILVAGTYAYGDGMQNYDFTYEGELTPEILADGLSELTNINFEINSAEISGQEITIDWSNNSALIAGVGDEPSKDEFFFYDNITLNWFMMDSLYFTIINNFNVDEVYYTMDGGKELVPTDMGTSTGYSVEGQYLTSVYDVYGLTPAEYNEFIALAIKVQGLWHIDGDTSAAGIYFDGSGNFEAIYGSGSVEERGYLKVISVSESGLNSFELYSYSDELFATITFTSEDTFKTIGEVSFSYKKVS